MGTNRTGHPLGDGSWVRLYYPLVRGHGNAPAVPVQERTALSRRGVAAEPRPLPYLRRTSSEFEALGGRPVIVVAGAAGLVDGLHPLDAAHLGLGLAGAQAGGGRGRVEARGRGEAVGGGLGPHGRRRDLPPRRRPARSREPSATAIRHLVVDDV
eukprot:scaffold27513_cov42-Phaeocystis_antarctica.AAC.4